MIRHITEASNTEKGRVVDPSKVKHGVITAGRISDLSGWIDPATHLNLDSPGSLVSSVVVSTKLEIGAPVCIQDGKFVFAWIDPRTCRHFGKVDAARISQMTREISRHMSLAGSNPRNHYEEMK